jgi:hypothetical protein
MKRIFFTMSLLFLIEIFQSCTVEKQVYISVQDIEWKDIKYNENKGKRENVIIPDETTSAKTWEVNNQDFIVSTDNSIKIPAFPIFRPNKTSNLTSEIKTTIQESKDPNKKTKNQRTTGGKSQIVALILCILLGWIGVHRFYLGYTGTGILYLFTLGLFLIGWLIDLILLIIPNGLTPKGKTSYRE